MESSALRKVKELNLIDPESCTREKINVKLLNELITTLHQEEEELMDLSDYLTIVGNDTRLKMFFLLTETKELSPCDFSDILNISTPAISQQIRRLRDLKLLQQRREGKTIYYSLTDNPFNAFIKQLLKSFKEL